MRRQGTVVASCGAAVSSYDRTREPASPRAFRSLAAHLIERIMDIARTPKKKRGKYIAIGAGVVAFLLLTLVLGSLPTAAPSVDRSGILID